jgi:hypothetical protein
MSPLEAASTRLPDPGGSGLGDAMAIGDEPVLTLETLPELALEILFDPEFVQDMQKAARINAKRVNPILVCFIGETPEALEICEECNTALIHLLPLIRKTISYRLADGFRFVPSTGTCY